MLNLFSQESLLTSSFGFIYDYFYLAFAVPPMLAQFPKILRKVVNSSFLFTLPGYFIVQWHRSARYLVPFHLHKNIVQLRQQKLLNWQLYFWSKGKIMLHYWVWKRHFLEVIQLIGSQEISEQLLYDVKLSYLLSLGQSSLEQATPGYYADSYQNQSHIFYTLKSVCVRRHGINYINK